MAKEVSIVTPIGIAVWPKLTKPDTYGEYADNKYKTELELSSADLANVRALIKESMRSMSFKVKQPKLPIKEGKDGIERLVAKSQFLPTIYDAKKNLVLDGSRATVAQADAIKIGGGSRIRLGCTLFNYDKGVSLQLNTVQLIELVESGGGTRSADVFDVEDGYEASEPELGVVEDEAHGEDNALDI